MLAKGVLGSHWLLLLSFVYLMKNGIKWYYSCKKYFEILFTKNHSLCSCLDVLLKLLHVPWKLLYWSVFSEKIRCLPLNIALRTQTTCWFTFTTWRHELNDWYLADHTFKNAWIIPFIFVVSWFEFQFVLKVKLTIRQHWCSLVLKRQRFIIGGTRPMHHHDPDSV